jgi:hypothetical protein
MKFQALRKRAVGFSQSLDGFLLCRGAWCLAAFALVYYGLYFNTGLVLTGEAGSNALIASRINEGWRPIKDMFVGYNLMWFYPLAWIFQLTGPNLLASQVFFMGLSAATGLLGFLLVRAATGSGILAAAAGTLMVLMPGAIFRNYMGFIGTLASFALVKAYILPAPTRVRQLLWMALCGAAVSLCYLVRIEPSLLITVVWAGLAILYPIGVRGEFFPRLRLSVFGTLLAVCAFAAFHAPFVVHSGQRGFRSEFTGQYGQFVGLLCWELEREISKVFPKTDRQADLPKPQQTAPAAEATPPPPAAQAQSQPGDGRLRKPELSKVLGTRGASYLDRALYFPVLSASLLALSGAGLFFAGAIGGNPVRRCQGLALLATTGCSLSLFPQYFFFRPDSVHLAEFMVPFYPALACAAAVGLGFLKNASSSARVFGGVLLAVCLLQAFIAFNALFGREGSGSIRMARGKTALFTAPGGIWFRVRPGELADWEGLRNGILAHGGDGDFVVTYPYVPVLNVMSGRPSYQFKLYVDNATESASFPAKAIADLEKHRPAVVVVNNRDINKSEFSRFKNWAAPFYSHLAREYVLEGTYFKEVEVFVRPDLAAGGGAKD